MKTDDQSNGENQDVGTDRTADSGDGKPKSPKSPRNKSPKSPSSAKKLPTQPVASSSGPATSKKGKKTPEVLASQSIEASAEDPLKEKK